MSDYNEENSNENVSSDKMNLDNVQDPEINPSVNENIQIISDNIQQEGDIQIEKNMHTLSKNTQEEYIHVPSITIGENLNNFGKENTNLIENNENGLEIQNQTQVQAQAEGDENKENDDDDSFVNDICSLKSDDQSSGFFLDKLKENEQKRANLENAAKDLPIPLGIWRNAGQFSSVQKELPAL
jgi:hypothetical protein